MSLPNSEQPFPVVDLLDALAYDWDLVVTVLTAQAARMAGNVATLRLRAKAPTVADWVSSNGEPSRPLTEQANRIERHMIALANIADLLENVYRREDEPIDFVPVDRGE